ncbi:MAG: hypothetical protein M3259_08555, partial [Actinomycetota bacterium]|nr:hypothetical protein [Actinomycetota bacterium]
IVQGRQPLNVESPQYLLRQSFVTPTELFFTRNRGTIPEVVPGPIVSLSPAWRSGRWSSG